MIQFQKAELVISAPDKKLWPDTTLPEIVLAGRSNVGKSSFINAMCGRKKLAYVGNTPGKTRLLNFFNLDDKYMFVDVPGYGYYDTAKGRFEGMEVDLCYQIAAAVFGVSYKEARAQELVEFTDVTPKTRGPLIDNGQLDVVAATYTITDERKQSVDFSDAYAMAQLAILANADSGVASIDDLNQPGKKVAVKTGSTGDVYATKNLADAEIVRLADESACVTEVVQGKADGFLYDQLTIYRNHQANPDTTEAVFIPFQDAEEWGIAVKKGNTELLDQLNAFIAQSKTDGEFDRLTEKYLADEKKAFDQYGFKWFFDFE